MNNEDVKLLVNQIRRIALNKSLEKEIRTQSEELNELQDAIFMLSDCLVEVNDFLDNLRSGNLDVQPPGRYNFLAGNLKELHSALKHLTWQANQVANGDYNQRVDFLGDFSTSFNLMIQQLAEREAKLMFQANMLSETVDLMKSVMDGLNDWIIVMSKENGEIVYANKSAKTFFFDDQTGEYGCGENHELIQYLKQYGHINNEDGIFEHTCNGRKKFFEVKSYSIQWNEKLAHAHYIKDVTSEKEYKQLIEEWAYTDALTGLNNRRGFLESFEKLVKQEKEFTFCIIDLDGLKYANDNFGHAAGDEYLRLVTQEMKKITSDRDLLCRIGGDEFVILFHFCTEQDALDKMKRFNDALMGITKEYPMSASYGAVYVKEGTLVTAEEIMQQADEKMYVMKNMKKPH